MQLPQTRQQRRAAERSARKLARKAAHPLAAQPAPVPAQGTTEGRAASASPKHSFSPELEDEFSPEFLSYASSVYERFNGRAAARRTACSAESDCAEINRPNAHHSTDPRTPEGKLASSRNSLKHGLASSQLIMPGEDTAEFEALLAGLLAEHQPANPTEELLVRQIAQSWWLTQRALRLQNECFTDEGVDQKRLSLFLRYQTTHERAFHKALSTLIRLKKDRVREFVSQNSGTAKLKPRFVSQIASVTPVDDQFVSQNEPSEGRMEGIAE